MKKGTKIKNLKSYSTIEYENTRMRQDITIVVLGVFTFFVIVWGILR
jgi:uncharacterized protein HemY